MRERTFVGELMDSGEYEELERNYAVLLGKFDAICRTLGHIRDLAAENNHGIDGYGQIAEWAEIHIPERREAQPS